MLSGSFYSLLAVVAGQGFALATSIIYARLLGRDDLGVLAIYVQLGSVASAVATLSLGTATARYVAKLRAENRAQLGRFVSTVLVITILSASLAAVLLFVVAGPLGESLYGSLDLVVMIRLSALYLPLTALSALGSAVLQGMQAIRKLAVLGVFLEALGVPVTYFSLVGFGLVGAAIGGVVTTGVSLFLVFGTAWRDLRRTGVTIGVSFHRDHAQDVLHYAAPLIVSSVVIRMALLYQSVFLVLSLGFGDAGLFKVASTLYRILLFVPAAMSVPLLPLTSELYATATTARAKESLTTILRITSFAGMCVALGVGLAASSLILVLYGSDFVDAAPLAFVLAIAGFVETIDTVSVNSALGEGRTRLLLKLDLLHAVIIVLTTTVFVSRFGLIGVGFAMLTTSGVHTTLLLVILSVTKRLNARRVAPVQALAAAGFVLAASAVVFADALHNFVLAALIVASVIVAGLVLMEPGERQIMSSVLRNPLRTLRS